MAKSVGPEGRVLSFEPQPEMQEQLSLMRKRFGFHSVELIQKGLSDKPGVLTMARPENNWGGASFENRTHQCAMENFDVEVICLDDNEVSGVTFVKCDV
jgi:FkbM family methyltransferase